MIDQYDVKVTKVVGTFSLDEENRSAVATAENDMTADDILDEVNGQILEDYPSAEEVVIPLETEAGAVVPLIVQIDIDQESGEVITANLSKDYISELINNQNEGVVFLHDPNPGPDEPSSVVTRNVQEDTVPPPSNDKLPD